jgi:hypothetical protein
VEGGDGEEGDDANRSPTTRRAGRRRDKVRPFVFTAWGWTRDYMNESRL